MSPKKCQWCSGEYTSNHPTKLFCSKECQNNFGNWCASRGKILMPIALAWRTQRGRKGVGSDAMKEMVLFLDKCAAEFNSQGSQPIHHHFSATRKSGSGARNWRDFPRERPSRSKLATQE
jgi:endogenous inhibitor of DNA gyrase (YacG/DUF329 family)